MTVNGRGINPPDNRNMADGTASGMLEFIVLNKLNYVPNFSRHKYYYPCFSSLNNLSFLLNKMVTIVWIQ